MEPDTVPPEETLKASSPEVISLLCDDEDDDDDAKVSVVDENSAKNEINVEAGTSTEPSSCVALQEVKGEARDVTRGSSPNKTSHEMKAETRHETDPSRTNCENVTAQTSKFNSDSKASMSTSAVDIIIDIVSDDEKQSIGDAGENPSISNAEKVVQRRLTEGRRETATRQSPHTSVFDLRASSAIKELKLDMCTAQEVVNILIPYLEECVISEESASVSGNAPRFLAQFRASYALAEAISTGIEWIEKAHDYKEAARRWQDLLRLQTSHRRRGYWYNRLSIDQKHLGASQAAAETLVACLLDRSVPEHSAHRIEAEKRLTKLLRNRTTAASLPHAKNVLTSQSGNNGDMQVSEITIFGRRRASAQGRRPRVGERCEFFSAEDTPSMYCHVEEFVLEHFEQTGGWLGMHCEGQIFRALFAIFMWDAIFDEGVPDVFQTPFQHGPLDLFHCSGVFVDARRAKIEAILGDLQSASSASLAQRAKTSWDAHEGVQVCGMRWDAYPRETLACVAACIGPKVLVAILRRLCEDYNHWAGGGPDLLLYRVSRAPSLVANEARPDLEEIDNLNLEVRPIDIVSKALPPTSSAAAEQQQQQQQRGRRAARHVQPLDFSESTETGVELRFEAWFLEVKSETDRLSHKQSGWLRYLESAGARAGVCHVRAS
ncbi:Fanconi-associated nuclease 1-like [Hondaea fermentalgiana]|uniref:Fanconi-associated nuclease n=1 Tax=Hondaea fermentalgiana TaxID=2315210 RepID=A0A2R5GK72_9STRA|nr:Fanconi-associated nuclease 1-like [Hondaea fermentalgiana]|eukprot:GBG31025.1 Fanconi-associated nuclease 1-like [Hondaea fermentalgiana]